MELATFIKGKEGQDVFERPTNSLNEDWNNDREIVYHRTVVGAYKDIVKDILILLAKRIFTQMIVVWSIKGGKRTDRHSGMVDPVWPILTWYSLLLAGKICNLYRFYQKNNENFLKN